MDSYKDYGKHLLKAWAKHALMHFISVNSSATHRTPGGKHITANCILQKKVLHRKVPYFPKVTRLLRAQPAFRPPQQSFQSWLLPAIS